MTHVQRLFVAALIGSAVFAPTAARAQEGDAAGVIYQKKTTVSFEEDTIDGDLTKPDATYVEARKRVRHSNLIRVREDFREQILRSVSRL
ncbi:MAG: adventurous gliding motility protein CglF [Deltaproteobacteria bacterium]|nr:adventurous gliding motility protein CglF [Deltaproteobacteria bacterium]